jgi:hypothetical protein
MPPYGIAQFYDQVYGDLVDQINQGPRNIDVPMTSDEIMAGSILNNFDADRFQSVFPTESIYTSPTYMTKQQVNPFFQAPIDVQRFEGIGSLGRNDADVEQVEFLGSQPNRFQQGIGKLFELAQRFSPIAAIARGINSLRDRFDTRQAIREDIARDNQGTINQVTSPRITNMQPSDRDRGMGRQPSRSNTSQRQAGPGYDNVSEAGSF